MKLFNFPIVNIVDQTSGGVIMTTVYIIIGGILLIYMIVMVPIHYQYLVETKERLRRYKNSHEKMYDKMSFEEQQLQYNMQGSIINLPSALIASLIYNLRHRK